jgi:hypothetical protein
LDTGDLDALHTGSIVEPAMSSHTAGISALLWDKLEHRMEEIRDALRFFFLKVVLLAEHVRQGPVP